MTRAYKHTHNKINVAIGLSSWMCFVIPWSNRLVNVAWILEYHPAKFSPHQHGHFSWRAWEVSSLPVNHNQQSLIIMILNEFYKAVFIVILLSLFEPCRLSRSHLKLLLALVTLCAYLITNVRISSSIYQEPNYICMSSPAC